MRIMAESRNWKRAVLLTLMTLVVMFGMQRSAAGEPPAVGTDNRPADGSQASPAASPAANAPVTTYARSLDKDAVEKIVELPITRLVIQLALRLRGEWCLGSVAQGEVTPAGWPVGKGHQIALWQARPPAAGEDDVARGEIIISLMEEAESYRTPPASAETDAAKVVGQWNDQAVLVSSRQGQPWGGFRQALMASIQASQRPLAASLRGSRVFIGQRQERPEADEAKADAALTLTVVDGAREVRKQLRLPAGHPLREHALAAEADFVLAVVRAGDEVPVALLPLSQLRPPVGPEDEKEELNPIRRVSCLISGRVQGVGYRDWTRRQANELKLTGWVMNLADGRVAALVEGPRPQVDELIKRMHRGPYAANVTGVEAKDEEPREDMREFVRRN